MIFTWTVRFRFMSTYQLTPPQLELQALRRAAKAKQASKRAANVNSSSRTDEGRGFLHRDWIRVRDDPQTSLHKVKIVAWNVSSLIVVRRGSELKGRGQMLAQTLVRT